MIDIESLYDVVIIGAGPAGLCAAVYAARAKYKVLVVEKEKIGGQITITSEVVNYPGILKISGKELTENIKEQAINFGAEFLISDIIDIDVTQDIKILKTTKKDIKTIGIIVATGANPRVIGFKGEQEFKGRGVAYCATCDGEFFTGLDVFVIGGGFAAAEEAIFLTKYAKKVTIIVMTEEFTCAKSIAEEVMKHKGIEVYFNTEIIEAGGDNVLKYAIFKNNKTGETWKYNTDTTFGIFVFAGYVPATKLVRDKVKLDDSGYIVTDINRKTNIDGIYAAGDVCIKNLRQVVTAVADGAIAATSLEKYISTIYEKLKLPERKQLKKEKIYGEDKEDINTNDNFITNQMKSQLIPVFEKFEKKIILKVFLDNTNLSDEIEKFIKEFEQLTQKVECKIIKEDNKSEIIYPSITFYNEKDEYLGIQFHAVPGGHEFNSFIIALYNSSGKGQEISNELLQKINNIKQKINIKIAVSLSCTMCPEVVMASQKIASLNKNIDAQVFDLQYYPDLKEKYQIMSVPCMIVNDNEVYFGKKNLEQILEILNK